MRSIEVSTGGVLALFFLATTAFAAEHGQIKLYPYALAVDVEDFGDPGNDYSGRNCRRRYPAA